MKKILRQESAVLPMGSEYQRQKTGVIQGGIAGGALRSSSGYGFQESKLGQNNVPIQLQITQTRTTTLESSFKKKWTALF